jgi:hypothetical protein
MQLMADELTTGGGSAVFHCPWCSAALPAAALETCPTCGATLTSAPEAALPGVTAIDHEAILRASRQPTRPQRSRLLSWISGDYVEDSTPTDDGTLAAIAPPDPAVKREILRLEIEAELADRQAEADSIMADAAVEGRPMPGADEPVIEDIDPSGAVATDDVPVAPVDTAEVLDPEAESDDPTFSRAADGEAGHPA